MKLVHYIALFVILFTVAWASLFFTILNQTSKLNRTLNGIQTVLNQDNAILKAQKKQPTTTDLNTKLIAVQTHIDCLFNLATQPNHSSAYIANAQTCTIAAPGSTVVVPQPRAVPAPSPRPTPTKAPTPKTIPRPSPKPTNLDKLPLVGGILKAIGL